MQMAGMENKRLNEYIESYINFYADKKVIERGRKLYEEGAVEFLGYTIETDTNEFSVQGSKLYKVHVRNLKNRMVETSCTCPYSWGSLCKHAVAALLNLADPNAVSCKPEKTQQRISLELPQSYALTDYKLITEELVRKHTSPTIFRNISFESYYYRFTGFQFDKNKVVFQISGRYSSHEVIFTCQNDKVFVTSTNTQSTKKLNKEEAICLLKIAKSTTPNLLDLFFSDAIQENHKNILQKFGFDENDDFNQYFKWSFNEQNGLVAYFNSNALGLLPVVETEANYFVQFFEKLNNDDLVINPAEIEKENRGLGFVVDFNEADPGGDDFDDDYYDAAYETEDFFCLPVIPIIGKPNKTQTMLQTHIEEFEPNRNDYQVEVAENARELLALIEQEVPKNRPKEWLALQKRAVRVAGE